MASITPTIGRRVWYFASANEKRFSVLPFHRYGDGALDAGIAHVNEDGTVNLSVSDSAGHHHARQNVRFIADDETAVPTDGSAYATWMPFQFGQAKAAEEPAQLNAPPLAPIDPVQVAAPPLAQPIEPEHPEQQQVAQPAEPAQQ